jgi:serine/threonine protein phosphatase PrpC
MTFFERISALFRRRGRPDSPPAKVDAPHVSIDFESLSHERRILVGTGQSAGIERSHNEDALLVFTGQSAGQEPLPDFGLFVVADGMGGHRAGEVASAISVRTVARELTQKTIVDMLDPEPDYENELPIQDLIRDAMEEANQAVVDAVPGGGTTLTAAVLMGNQVTIGHVGDSRAYVIENGRAEVLTRDHSLVERLRELGQLTPEEAANHPQRNVLYRAIGQGANLEIDVFTTPAPKGGSMLLCSDGLWGVISDERILKIVNGANHPQSACEELVKAANAAGGPDNITAVLVRFPEN